MGGHSGSAVAAHTPVVKVGAVHFALTAAQQRLVARALSCRGSTFVRGQEVRSAQKLVLLGVGTLIDDGAFGSGSSSNNDGERWTFTLAAGVSLP